MEKNIILFDGDAHLKLRPITYTRPVAEIRCGILTIADKWRNRTNSEVSFLTEAYLAKKFPVRTGQINLFVSGNILPTPDLVTAVESLSIGSTLLKGEEIIAVALDEHSSKFVVDAGAIPPVSESKEKVSYDGLLHKLNSCVDIFEHNAQEIGLDYELITKGRTSQQLDHSVSMIGENIFVEEGATVTHAILNATAGPIYIASNAEIMEGSMIRGPLALGEGSEIKMGSKIYGATTIGPHCKVGGELNNVVFQGYSNKAHDGFLGNSVIGQWCNLGADTNCSNLKNDYGNVKMWDYKSQRLKDSGRRFCGLIMGDHSKSGINTMFNTGTTVGISSNIFGAGFPVKFIPSFSWGGADGIEEYRTYKALEVAKKVAVRRNIVFTEDDKSILEEVFEITKQYRAGQRN